MGEYKLIIIIAVLSILLITSLILFIKSYQTQKEVELRYSLLQTKFDRKVIEYDKDWAKLDEEYFAYKGAYNLLTQLIRNKPVAVTAGGIRSTYEVKSNNKIVSRGKTKTSAGTKNSYQDATMYLQVGKEDRYIAYTSLQDLSVTLSGNPEKLSSTLNKIAVPIKTLRSL